MVQAPQEAPLRSGTRDALKDAFLKTGQQESNKEKTRVNQRMRVFFFKSTLVVKIIKISHIKMDCSQRIWIMNIIVFSFLTGERFDFGDC